MADLLPASVISELADPTIPEIRIPRGRWRVTPQMAIRIKRPVRLIGEGVTLIPEVAVPLEVHSQFLEGGTARVEHHAVGVITPDRDNLTLPVGVDLRVGETVLVRSGVRGNDPAEPEIQTWQTVAEIRAGSVRFAMPFGRTVKQWPDYEAIVAAAGETQRHKTGAWEARPGYYSRGLGYDHGIVRFAGGAPVSGVTVEGLTVKWPGVAAPYGAWSFAGQYVRDLRFGDVKVINPRGSCVHLTSCDNSGVEGMQVSGDGDSNDWNNPAAHSAARLLTLWGGNGCYARDLNAVGRDIVLVNCEVGSVGTMVERASIRTSYTAGWKVEPHFGVHGNHPGFTFRDIRLDIPQGGILFTSATAPGLVLENLALESGVIPDWLPLSRFKFLGTLRIGSTVYGPVRHVSTDTLVSTSGTELNVPPGLYVYASVTLSTRTGVKSVQGPSDVFAGNPGLSLPMPANEWGQVKPGDVTAYLATRKINVWLNQGAAGQRVRFDGDCL